MMLNTDRYIKRETAIRIIKKQNSIIGLPHIKINADFYCELLQDKNHFYETDKEFVFYITHFSPLDACIASIDITLEQNMEIDKIYCETRLLDFSQQDNTLHFDTELSRLTGRSVTLDAHSIIHKPGITLRMEQNDKGRRAGRYMNKYPETEIIAAYHYMFAMYEILEEMHLPEYLSENNLGYMLILGFETYNTIHEDYPPHWHLIYRWPLQCGSQAPHIYIGEDGKMIQNKVSIDCMPNIFQEIKNDSWFSFVNPYGNTILQIQINSDGTMSCRANHDTVYKIGSYLQGNGVSIHRNGIYYRRVKVWSDSNKGETKITIIDDKGNTIRKHGFHFNPVNGNIL